MHLRLSFWAALFAFVFFGALRAQTPSGAGAGAAAAPTVMAPGQIVAKQVTGKVSMRLNGTTTELHNDDAVGQSATVVTQNESSVILVFSNGATTQLGPDTTLVIDEFLQDPFKDVVAVANLTEEPTRSHTKLHLTKGELVGKVAHLKHEQGSYFTVQTPVGAAGIRGTTFRIVFRPSGTGQAFAVFSLSTVEGNVNFQQGSPPPGGPATPPSQSPNQPGGTQPEPTPGPGGAQGPSQPASSGQPTTPGTSPAPAGGVAVTGGQEVVVTVTVNVNQQTGQVTVAAPPTITSTQPISVATQQAIVEQAQTMVTTAAQTTFTPPTPTPPTTTSNQNSSSGQGDQQQGQQTDGTSSGGTSSTSGSASTPVSGTPSTQPPAPPTPPIVTPPSPPPTTPTPQLTPGAGKG